MSFLSCSNADFLLRAITYWLWGAAGQKSRVGAAGTVVMENAAILKNWHHVFEEESAVGSHKGRQHDKVVAPEPGDVTAPACWSLKDRYGR
ncbi:conserved hypothetical protein [Agrobacterium fabacearum S56]|uniref:Uncharacterized protein n=1 Tax=Agrobacterium tumefaciens TaxID=358 RepID=A0A5B9T1E6_AGRTU|nr:hypothetical protein AgrTiKerr108_00063 [Agrobacterium tumefaciens]CUX06466.1 conserved hypothetical protein [Agrobacterium fabacearum S56]